MLPKEKPFEPTTVTKPIQLLAAWLIGLILVNGSFLSAAAIISRPEWAAGFLVVCAAFTVPIFLGALFLLQTKFRPEMQEDTYYAKYLERRSAETRTLEIVRVTESANPQPRIPTKPAQSPHHDINEDFDEDVFSDEKGVLINDLLPDYRDIAQSLIINDIIINETFGSIEPSNESPEEFGITIGSNFDTKLAAKIIKIVRPFGVAHVALTNQGKHGIFIGAYTYKYDQHSIRELDDILFEQLTDENISRKEFRNLIR